MENIEPRNNDRSFATGVALHQFARDGFATLADVIKLVHADAGLSPSKRRSMIKNIEKACQWFNLSPSDVIAHPMNLRPRFARVSPGGLGISRKRIQNVRSALKAALRRVHLIDGRSFKVPLSAAWRALLATIPDRYLRDKVRCIASYASATGVNPDQVDNAFSERLLAALLADRLHGNPRIVHQCAIRAWNQLVSLVPGWPRTMLTQPMYRRIKTPNAEMDVGLQAAIDTFLVRNSTSDPFDLSTPITEWKPSTVATYRRYLKRYFGLLVTLGHVADSFRRLSDLVSIDRAKAALKLMIAQNDGRSRIGASHIARLLSQIATEAVRQEPDLPEEKSYEILAAALSLRAIADRLHKRGYEFANRTRERLTPLREEANLARLFLLPFALAKEVEKASKPTRNQALLMQWAVALMILTFCPLRITSLCELRIDRHLKWSRPGMKGELHLEFGRRELKGEAHEILPLPRECAQLIRTYLIRFRPMLDPGHSMFMFSGRTATRSKLRGVLSGQLQSLVFKRTGFDVNPHLYRHLVHLVVLTRFPGAYAMISRVLTHRSLETAKRNYAYFDVELSLKAYHKLVRDIQLGRSNPAPAADVAYNINREDMNDCEW